MIGCDLLNQILDIATTFGNGELVPSTPSFSKLLPYCPIAYHITIFL